MGAAQPKPPASKRSIQVPVLYVGHDRVGFERLRKVLARYFRFEFAVGPSIAVGLLKNKGPFPLMVCDIGAPVHAARKLISRAHEIAPETMQVLVAESNELEESLLIANEVGATATIPGPPDAQQLKLALTRAYRENRKNVKQNRLRAQALHNAADMMIDILSLVNPSVFNRVSRVTNYCRQLAKIMDLSESWQLLLASKLSKVGMVTMPAELIDKVFSGRELSEEDEHMLSTLPEVSSAVLNKLQHAPAVLRIIKGSEEDYSPPTRSQVHGKLEREITASHILRAATDFDHLSVLGHERGHALAVMKERAVYCPRVLVALERTSPPELRWRTRALRVDQLAPGMVLAENIRQLNGTLLAGRGEEVSAEIISRLADVADSNAGIHEPFRAMVPVFDGEPDGDHEPADDGLEALGNSDESRFG